MVNTKRRMWHLARHLSSPWLLRADEMGGGTVLSPSTRRLALDVYQEYSCLLPTVTMACDPSGEAHLDGNQRIEVVPLGAYRSRQLMEAALQECFQVTTAVEVVCDGRGIIGAEPLAPTEEDQDLPQAVTVVQCRGRYLAMLALGEPRTLRE